MDVDMLTTLMATLAILGLAGAAISRFVPSLNVTVAPAATMIAAVVAILATLSSLYLSGIEHYTPCRFCWWQRIFMYPLAIILPISMWRKQERDVRWYAIPLATIGLLISIYHSYIQRNPGDTETCDPAAPCSQIWVEAYGFLTIPNLAGLCFAIILVLLTRKSVTAA